MLHWGNPGRTEVSIFYINNKITPLSSQLMFHWRRLCYNTTYNETSYIHGAFDAIKLGYTTHSLACMNSYTKSAFSDFTCSRKWLMRPNSCELLHPHLVLPRTMNQPQNVVAVGVAYTKAIIIESSFRTSPRLQSSPSSVCLIAAAEGAKHITLTHCETDAENDYLSSRWCCRT